MKGNGQNLHPIRYLNNRSMIKLKIPAFWIICNYKEIISEELIYHNFGKNANELEGKKHCSHEFHSVSCNQRTSLLE